ncbi:MAG TPA: MaoC family dehydratase N-terminal domain-containing protein [Acidimicrobiales bacterium]|jgi:acyl dehydratase
MSAETVPDIPADVSGWIGQERHGQTANFPVEQGYIWTSCASVENGNPLFWDDKVAAELTDGPIAPPTTLSLWFRPHFWEPDQAGPRNPLQTHFDLKERLELPEAVMTESVVVFADPVRPGDVIGTSEMLRSISGPKTTKLGTGRFWVIDVDYRNQHGALVGTEIFTGFGYRRAEVPAPAAAAAKPAEIEAESALIARETPQFRGFGVLAGGEVLPPLAYDVTASTVVLGALATRDWRPMHHDVDFAVNRNGTTDIFLNTPNQQAWFERYVTDWTGPRGRLGRLRFRMLDSIFPGDTMTFTGTVQSVTTDPTGCGWAELAIELHAEGRAPRRLCTTCNVRVALPTDSDDNPWSRRDDQWRPLTKDANDA